MQDALELALSAVSVMIRMESWVFEKDHRGEMPFSSQLITDSYNNMTYLRDVIWITCFR